MTKLEKVHELTNLFAKRQPFEFCYETVEIVEIQIGSYNDENDITYKFTLNNDILIIINLYKEDINTERLINIGNNHG